MKEEIKMAIMIPIHHTQTEVVPLTNCWSWQVFTHIDWGRAWKCMSEVDYNAMREQQIKDWRVAWSWILWIIVWAILIAIVWIWRDNNH